MLIHNGTLNHAAKLYNLKYVAVPTNTQLREENGPFRVDLYDQCACQYYGDNENGHRDCGK
jgi:hypothetical protein